jgi:hypothetical protein
MESLDVGNATNETLITLAAGGNSDARQLLATRLRKLRGMGNNDDARHLRRGHVSQPAES